MIRDGAHMACRRDREGASSPRRYLEPSCDLTHPEFLQVPKGRVVHFGSTCWVLIVAIGNHNNHTLTGASQEHAVGVHKILLPLWLADSAPLGAREFVVLPAI